LRVIRIDVQTLHLRIMDCSFGSGKWKFYLEKVTQILQIRLGFKDVRIDFHLEHTSCLMLLRNLLTALSKNPIQLLKLNVSTLLMERIYEGMPISPRVLKTVMEAHCCCPANAVTHPRLKRWMIRECLCVADYCSYRISRLGVPRTQTPEPVCIVHSPPNKLSASHLMTPFHDPSLGSLLPLTFGHGPLRWRRTVLCLVNFF
jgi:hypothetical protein